MSCSFSEGRMDQDAEDRAGRGADCQIGFEPGVGGE